MGLMGGCALKTPSSINPNLPVISELKTISDMTQIAFEWTPVKNDLVAGYYLYRMDSSKNAMSIIANIKNKFSTHYVDTGLLPATKYVYELRSYDANNNISDHGAIIKVSTSKLIDSVAFAQAVYGLPNQVKILWRPHTDPRVDTYIIQRNNLRDNSWREVATIKGRLNAEYIDTRLEPNTDYRYRILVKTTSGIISAPSEIISATTKPLPDPVSNVYATTNLPKTIELKWDKNTNKDFDHYVIYRASSKFFPALELAKTKDNKYSDFINDNGKTMYYSVTAVDKDGLESIKQSDYIIGTTLRAPVAPTLSSVSFNGVSVDLNWVGGDDLRTVRYIIIKSAPDQKITIDQNITGEHYSDPDVQIGLQYSYRVVGVDKFGINSNPSNELDVVVR